MSRFIQMSYVAGRTINPFSSFFCGGYLTDDVDGVGTLLGLSIVAPKKNHEGKLKAEMVFQKIFSADVVMGTNKHDPRVKAINLEKSPWDFETSPLVCYWALVPGLSSMLVSQAGARYWDGRLMADSDEKLNKLLSVFKATPTEKGVMGSHCQRIVGRSHELTGKSKTGESDAFYLYGPDLDAARKKFFHVMLAMEIPLLAEWDNHFWKLFLERGWVKELNGFGMYGYKIAMNKEAICELISQEIKTRHAFLRPPQVPAHLWI